jgi:hypothetical protein
MNVRQFEFETVRWPGDGAARLDTEVEARAAMRADPAARDSEQQDEEPLEEPGYGHGV